MSKMISRRSRKAGLPPGTPVHIGQQTAEPTRISVLSYDEQNVTQTQPVLASECEVFRQSPLTSWIMVQGLRDIDALETLGRCFGMHPLVLEDIVNTDQRPKLEDYGDYLYMVLKMLTYREATHEVASEQLSLVLGPNFLICFMERESELFEPLRQRLGESRGRIRKMGADYIAYSVIDTVVDNYFSVLEKVGEQVETLEEELVSNPRRGIMRDIQRLKREMIFLRRSVWPLRELIGGLQRADSPLVSESIGIYLRDVYDHTIQSIDTIESLRDMLSGMLDIYLSSISNRMNEIMKVLTIIATIFIPLTFITGIYGMNFRHIPELGWRYGYPAALMVMTVIALAMLVWFRKKKWL